MPAEYRILYSDGQYGGWWPWASCLAHVRAFHDDPFLWPARVEMRRVP